MTASTTDHTLSLQRLGMPFGRALLGSLFVVSGLLKIGRFAAVAAGLEKAGLPWGMALAAAVIVFEVAAGLALAIGWRTRLAGGLLALFVVAATLLFHRFWDADAAAYGNQLNHFLKNLALTGALLMVASASHFGSRVRALAQS